MGRLFGTDGVRGAANRELTPELALMLGRAGAYVLTRETARQAPKILVGKDTRRSGDMLEAALTAGLCSLGAVVYQAGVIPTPGIAHLTRAYDMDAGVMISASHNPMEDNGIKFFNGDGLKLPDRLEDEIEALCGDRAGELPRPEGMAVGISVNMPQAQDDYAHFLQATVPGLRLDGMKIALDCANGALSAMAPAVFKRLGATVYALHNEPDGNNINADCGSTHMASVQAFVKEKGMDAGLAFDGDGDRVLAVDENGVLVDGDQILAVCALDLRQQGKLKHETAVATVMSNLGLTKMFDAQGLTLHKTTVGDRYVLEKMLAADYWLGGEQSGHIIFRQHNTSGDGVITGLQLLSVMRRTGKALSELKKVMEVFPQALVNARVANERKPLLAENEAINHLIAQTEAQLAGQGRLLVRVSGTEPVIRVMLEGRDQLQLNAWAEALARLIEQELG